ncbi:sugar transferase [Candidatus Parcubacteria bacterium]|nr:MAG: sugar transferase [Candidatus Parcubacteria bacterium]
MKKGEMVIAVITVPLDYLALVSAGLFSYWLRYLPSLQEARPIIFNLPFEIYAIWVFIIAFVWMLIFALSGMYEISGNKRLQNEATKIIFACSVGILAIILALFSSRQLFSSRFIILAAWICSILFIGFERLIIRLIQRSLYRRGIGVHRVAIIGNGSLGESLLEELSQKPTLGYKVIRRFSVVNDDTIAELRKNKNDLDEIIQLDHNISRNDALRLIAFANENNLAYKYAADLLESRVVNLEIEAIAGIPILEIKKTPLDGWGRVFKRVFDIFFSLMFIVLFSPVFLAAILLIKFDTPGPVLFKYKRVREKGKTFDFIKFRSMYDGSHQLRYDKGFLAANKNLREGSPMIKIKDDPRITTAGKILRRWSIDELPQLFLVLTGKMSLIGPRPHEKEEVDNYQGRHKKVLSIKPGITGLAQISGRSDLDFEEEIRLDTYYIENWSIMLDISILLRTPLAVLRKRETL